MRSFTTPPLVFDSDGEVWSHPRTNFSALDNSESALTARRKVVGQTKFTSPSKLKTNGEAQINRNGKVAVELLNWVIKDRAILHLWRFLCKFV